MSSHAYHRLYFHFAWAVKRREPILVDVYQEFITEALRAVCEERGVSPLAVYAMPDHVHLFVRLPPTVAPAAFIGQIKGASARKFNATFGNRLFLKWQDGYGVVTVREAEQDKVIHYVENQATIHANRKASKFLESTTDPTNTNSIDNEPN